MKFLVMFSLVAMMACLPLWVTDVSGQTGGAGGMGTGPGPSGPATGSPPMPAPPDSNAGTGMGNPKGTPPGGSDTIMPPDANTRPRGTMSPGGEGNMNIGPTGPSGTDPSRGTGREGTSGPGSSGGLGSPPVPPGATR